MSKIFFVRRNIALGGVGPRGKPWPPCVVLLPPKLSSNSRCNASQSPWQELDREDAAFRQYGRDGCLGFTPELGSWYGGKVTFTMRLHATKDGGFHFYLEHPVLGPSSRFTRTYGSAWLVRVRISKDIFSKPDLSEKLRSLLVKPLILNGLVFRFFYANKDHNAYLMATNEPYAGTRLQSPLLNGQNRLLSFLDFFSTHNNLMDNSYQARSALPCGRKTREVLISFLDNRKMGGANCTWLIEFRSWVGVGCCPN